MDGLLACTFTALAIVITCYAVSAENYYVRTTSGSECPTEETVYCLTLSQYATKPNNFFFASNTTLVLLPGNHILDTELMISNITHLHVSTTSPSLTTLTCSLSARFNFENIEQVTLSGLTISGCAENTITLVDQLLVEDCTFHGHGRNGTGLDMNFVHKAKITKCSFSSNNGEKGNDPFRPWITIRLGGAMTINHTNVSISNTNFTENRAHVGGVVFSLESSVEIQNCTFDSNTAATDGGAVSLAYSTATIYSSTFSRNTATELNSFGGAVHMFMSSSIISNCTFMNNTAKQGGGAVNIFDTNKTNSMINTEFKYNGALFGSAITVAGATLETSGLLNIHENEHQTISVFDSTITFNGHTFIQNNTYTNSSKIQQDGGAINSYRSTMTFTGVANISHNQANQGGAISAIDSTITFNGNVLVFHNEANSTGGGIYAYRSEVNFWGYTAILRNTAVKKGGGTHSVSTSISLFTNGSLLFTTNSAMEGGGLFLEANARLYLIKENTECTTDNHTCFTLDPERWLKLEFKNNSADYGGAIYVSDDTASGTCNAVPFRAQSTNGECFLQGLALHPWFLDNLNLRNVYFTDNSARIAGKTLFGGLLDRCTVSSFSEIFRVTKYSKLSPGSVDAISYFLNLTNIQRCDLKSEITSEPVRICFCKDNQPDCSYQPPALVARKGKTFNVSLVAVDQVNNTIPYTFIHNTFDSDAKLGDRYSNKQTNESCTSLGYNTFGVHSTEQLYLYARGPCKSSEASKRSINITLRPCPIGFQNSNVECICDPILYPKYIINCSIDHESVQRRGAVWISSLNFTGKQLQYAANPNCPFDYCDPTIVSVNLNTPDSADAQCAFNRSGTLCGSCKDGLSLTLGSSRCKECSNNWLSLLIFFAIAGVALIIFLLLFNLTAAVGTINGLIFYANIVGNNSSIFLPFATSNVLSVFIAWLNLDFGFETCFYDGLDGYAETWLQFLFPLYIFILVFIVIIASNCSQNFAHFLSNRNPVATLATLILLSYSKLIRTVVDAMSYRKMEYYNIASNESETSNVWLIDGNIIYLQGKHIPLFVTALIVLLVVLAFTFFLLFWQWLQRLSNTKCLSWLRNPKLNSFMDAYHAPHNKHLRFWTGLLLFMRYGLYLIVTVLGLVNTVGDPRNILLSIIFAIGALFLLKDLLRDKVYKNWLLNTLESSFLFNIIIFASGTLYIRETGGNQAALAYTSTTIAFLTFLGILIYHAFVSFKPLQRLAGKVKGETNLVLKKVKEKKSKAQLLELQDIKGLCEEVEESRDFTSFREPLLDDSITGSYNLVDDKPITQQCVTYTEV